MATLIKREKSRFWYAKWRSNGKMLTISTKVPIRGEIVDGLKETPTEARRRAQKLADACEAADKDGLRSEKVKSMIADITNEEIRETPTVRAYLQKYHASRTHELSQGTLVYMKTAYRLFIQFLKNRADHSIDKIRRSDVKEFISFQLRSVRRGTVKKYLTALAPAFKSAMEDEYIDKNPFFQIPVPMSTQYGKSVKAAFDQEEIAMMMERLPAEWRSMVIFCLCLGGQRLGDLATLKWNQIDMQKGVISLTTGKTKRCMNIPMINVLKQHILMMSRVNEYVHPDCAKHYNRNSAAYISYQFRIILTGKGIIKADETNAVGGRTRNVSPKTFHCLRATAATWLHHLGIDHALAKEIVGHDSEASHQLYIRPSDEVRREALEKLGDAFFDTAGLHRIPDANMRPDSLPSPKLPMQASSPACPPASSAWSFDTSGINEFFVYSSD